MPNIIKEMTGDARERLASKARSPHAAAAIRSGQLERIEDVDGVVYVRGDLMTREAANIVTKASTPTKDVAAIVAQIERNTAALRAEQAARTPTPTPEAKATPAPAPQGTDAARRRVFGHARPKWMSDYVERLRERAASAPAPATTTTKAERDAAHANATAKVFGKAGAR